MSTEKIEETKNVKVYIEDEEKNRFKSMSAEKKLQASLLLYFCAKELKRSWLKLQYSEYTNEQIENRLREIFLNART
ncbi:MAG: hypothetical protein HY963_09035 [Ignavibacteriales bacterium]|jgi:hypothetical protein|nr:hypothetical protein [Ignavibacteriales bacterium]